MKVEYDELYGQFVVWKVVQSAMFEKYKNRSKKKCQAYVKKNSKRKK